MHIPQLVGGLFGLMLTGIWFYAAALGTWMDFVADGSDGARKVSGVFKLLLYLPLVGFFVLMSVLSIVGGLRGTPGSP